MQALYIPFALDEEGDLWPAANAEKARTYLCPACRSVVILKRGSIKVAHFAHKTTSCSVETITHLTAKRLVVKAVRDWKLGKASSPLLQRACQYCRTLVDQLLPEKVDRASLECRLSDGSVADVVLIGGDAVQAAIEIRVTHAVDQEKASTLPVPFIELDGQAVVEKPAVWKPIVDKFKPLTCQDCKSAYSRFSERVAMVAKAAKIDLPTGYYRYGLCRCWKCREQIVVFAWPREGMHDESAPKLKPIPRIVQYRFSKTIRAKYWANTCAFCQSIQGDFFLFSEPEGPFFGINPSADIESEFEADMMSIARKAARDGLLGE